MTKTEQQEYMRGIKNQDDRRLLDFDKSLHPFCSECCPNWLNCIPTASPCIGKILCEPDTSSWEEYRYYGSKVQSSGEKAK